MPSVTANTAFTFASEIDEREAEGSCGVLESAGSYLCSP